MKKTILAIGSALMISAAANAQEQPLSLGIKASGSMSWLQGLADKKLNGKEGETSPRLFAGGGLTMGYAFHENVGVGIEVLYAGLGNEIKEKGGDEVYRINSHNLAIPLMVKLYPMGYDPEEGVLDIHLGVQGELPLAMDVEKGKKDSLTADSDFKKDEHCSPFTMSAIAGVGYELPEMGLTVEGRYHFGFMDSLTSDDKGKDYKKKAGLKEEDTLANQQVTVSVGYNFAGLLDM